ncbi:hypothetical protein IMCC3135_31125 [Granulosicoccus antarcticus IMCC3135]|uniref:Rhodanese domain-containing protein n=2 Tax=Granulosicoccus TaxID=437504 RepID=A0A2Z2P8R7_9GAMM|nr:hypothetical protein IMCC3135_31125 [Granulosicoccus antarcticus IMCC3135]
MHPVGASQYSVLNQYQKCPVAIMQVITRRLILRFLVLVLLLFTVPINFGWARSTFQTTDGQGPDKWASVWLIRTFINPLPVSLVENPTAVSGVTTFDMPGASYNRTGTATTYSALMQSYNISDQIAVKLGDIIHDIEINAWNPNQEVYSQLVETAFRQMQLDIGRNKVTQSCYFEFFNRVASGLAAQTLSIDTGIQTLQPRKGCSTVVSREKKSMEDSAKVPEMDLSEVLQAIARREEIVFLDTRERREYREGHIPGAINMTLRSLDSDSAQLFSRADRVIAYCVKDFRGYEAARKLRILGVDAVIMKPYGIKGWHTAGLPVAGAMAMTEYEAMEQLLRIAVKKSSVQ